LLCGEGKHNKQSITDILREITEGCIKKIGKNKET